MPAVEVALMRASVRRRTIVLRLRSSGRVSAMKVDVVRRGRTVAGGRLKVLVDGAATLRLRTRRTIRGGTVLVRLRGRDAQGRVVERALRARLSR